MNQLQQEQAAWQQQLSEKQVKPLGQIRPLVLKCLEEIGKPQPKSNDQWKALFELLTEKGKQIQSILEGSGNLQRSPGFSDISF